MKITRRLRIFGTVQGVGYRYSAYYAAQNFSVTGWVKNRTDGSVEAVAQGTEDAVEKFIAWCKKGPGLAHVDNVEVSEGPPEDFSQFQIADTQ